MSLTDKPHISHTQIDSYFNCGEAYRRRYIEGEKIPPGIALLVGTGVHSGARENFTQKIESHTDLAKDRIIEAAVAGYEAELAGGYELAPGDDIGAAKDQVASLAEVHADQQAPDYQPIACEKKIVIPFPNASHDILGYVDLTDDQNRVTDFKTGAKKKPQAAADDSMQLTIYAASHQIDTGAPPHEVRLDTLIKTKKPGRQVLVSHRGPADFQVLINRTNMMLAGLKAGVFPPAPIGHWMCNPKWCGYFHSCPYVNSVRLAAAESE